MFSDRTSWKLSHNRFTQTLDEVRAGGARILDLTASNPTRVGLEYDSQAILGALSSPNALDYDPTPNGLMQAREAVAEYYRHGAGEVHPKQIVLTTSTSEGYSHVFRLLCNAGDELLVPKPSYPLFEFLADLHDVRLAPYPLIYDHGWQIDFPLLEKVANPRTRGVVVVHPNNPTGSYVKPAEIELLNEFCSKRGLAVIVDEVFLDYALDGQGRRSFSVNHGVLTYTLSGLSKISALPQMKVGWVVTSGPGSEVEESLARMEVIADTYLSMNAPVQWAVPTLMEQRKAIQRQLLERIRKNLAKLDEQLARQKTSQRMDVEGGWYAVLRVPVTQSDEDLAIGLLQQQSVLVHPGHFYDFPRDGYLVLSLITSEAEFAEGIDRLLEHLH